MELSQFSFIEKILFIFLVFIEKIYVLFFKIIIFFKKIITGSKSFSFKIISVGNLSVGGTGKSVFVQYLVKTLSPLVGAVVLRGYKSKAESTGRSFLVSDCSNVFYDSSFVGDEAFMMAKNLGTYVVVGSSRAKSCFILDEKIDFAILDDSYQNHSIKKDLEILLLDARRPFENGHCLPAGRLREKDFSRADIIILTHANYVKDSDISQIKNKLSFKIDLDMIFLGKHSFNGLYLRDKFKIDKDIIVDKRILAFAGIGAFDSFESSVLQLGFSRVLFKKFGDHHEYSKKDLDVLLDYIYSMKVDLIITTQKDWVKINRFLTILKDTDIPVYVLRVGFSFLENDEERFLKILKTKVR